MVQIRTSRLVIHYQGHCRTDPGFTRNIPIINDQLANQPNCIQIHEHSLKLGARHEARTALSNNANSLLHHLVDDSLGRLLLVHDCTGLAHQEWSSVVDKVVIEVDIIALSQSQTIFSKRSLRLTMLLKSCSTGMIPFPVNSLISAARLFSQFSIYAFERTLNGRPVKMIVRTLSSNPAVRTASWWAFGAPASYGNCQLWPNPRTVLTYL